MKKYKCIRKCHYFGRFFKVGDVIKFENTPPHHFIEVVDLEENVSLPQKRFDPMKPNNQEKVSALSSFVKQEKFEGFASSLKVNEIKNELKAKGRPKKA